MDDKIEVPIGTFVHDVAVDAARTVIAEHVQTCNAYSLAEKINVQVAHKIEKIDNRISVLERRFNILIGAVIGSGALGGTVAGVITKLM